MSFEDKLYVWVSAIILFSCGFVVGYSLFMPGVNKWAAICGSFLGVYMAKALLIGIKEVACNNCRGKKK